MPVGLVLVAALLYIPTNMIGASLTSEIKSKSLGSATQIDSMLRSVPSQKQYEMEMQYQNRHSEDARMINKLSVQGTQRSLVSYRIFPEPEDTSQQLFDEFADSYREAIKDLVKLINGRDAPDKDFLKRKLGTPKVLKKSSGAKNSYTRKVDAVCLKRARSISVYASPQSFSWYNFWDNWKNVEFPGQKFAVEYCWHSQVAYWIYQDIVDSISQMNSDADSVLTSEVKRLIGVSFKKVVTDTVKKSSSVLLDEDKPNYVIELEDATIEKTVPWTGRISGKYIDVVHFSTAVIIDSRSVMAFMKSLCSQKEHTHRIGYSENGDEIALKHNQITVLASEISPVDLEDDVHKYNRYGDDAVVRLSLVCEYIFVRNGYDTIKPRSIKELLDPELKNQAAKSAKKSPKKKSTP